MEKKYLSVMGTCKNLIALQITCFIVVLGTAFLGSPQFVVWKYVFLFLSLG